MKVSLKEAVSILDTSYRDIAKEACLSYNAVYHLTIRKYKPTALSRLKVEAALNVIRLSEIDLCQRKIEQLRLRMALLDHIEIEF